MSIQFTVYELLIAFFKQRDIKFSQRELAYIVLASFAAGGISSSCTNAFEVLTVQAQTRPDIKIRDIIKSEGSNLLTKGLGARIYYNSVQSVVFFTVVTYVGKLWNVDLTD